MPVHNNDIAAAFEEIADLLDIEGANAFRVRAYRNAARVLRGLSTEVSEMLKAGRDLSELPGIGKDLAGKIGEVVKTGSCAILKKLHQELPYRSTVETDSWTERKDGSVRIEQTIFVERESQRKIVLGKAGATIKSIGADARKEIAGIIEQPVHLFLFVKVRENWGEDPDRYREMGLEFPTE